MRTHYLIIALIGALACHNPADVERFGIGRATVETDHALYHPMERVVFTIVNQGDRVIYYDRGGEIEGFDLYKQWNGSFGSAGGGCREADCETDLRKRSMPIAPGAAGVDTLPINSQAYSGSWRVRVALRDETGWLLPEDQRTSRTFQVEGSWRP
jgi:hypothetical protein